MKRNCFCIIILLSITSCFFNKKKEDNFNYLGKYYLDLSKSKVKVGEDSDFFKNLTFTLTSDSFKFSRIIPYEDDSIGTWEKEYIDLSIYLRLKFRTSSIWQVGPGNNYIDMPYWYTLEKYPKETGVLHFVKKGEK